MNRIDKALQKFFDVDTIRGTLRILVGLVLGFVFIWYLQDVLAFLYGVIGLGSFERSVDQARYHRAIGGSIIVIGFSMGALNIYGIHRQKRMGRDGLKRLP